MRNPVLWRNVALAFVAAGPVAIAVAMQLPEGAASNATRGITSMFGMMAIIFGACAALFAHLDVRAKQSLTLGEDILARWRIDAATWREFVALDSELNRSPDAYRNELQIREQVSAEGIVVIAGKTAVEIDGDIHRLPSRGTPEITHAEFNESRIRPSYIELHLYYPGGETGASGVPHSATRTALRFPVPAGAKFDAERLVAQYSGSLGGKPDFFHGRGDGSDPEDLTECWSCGFKTHKMVSHCQKCGATMQSRRWSRRFGVVLVVCGMIITSMMAVILNNLVPTMLRPGVEIDGSTFNGTAQQGLSFLAILSLVLAFGVTTLLYGFYQLKTGKRSKKVVSAMLGAVSLLMAFAWLLRIGGS